MRARYIKLINKVREPAYISLRRRVCLLLSLKLAVREPLVQHEIDDYAGD
jgi:hypothetical protein